MNRKRYFVEAQIGAEKDRIDFIELREATDLVTQLIGSATTKILIKESVVDEINNLVSEKDILEIDNTGEPNIIKNEIDFSLPKQEAGVNFLHELGSIEFDLERVDLVNKFLETQLSTEEQLELERLIKLYWESKETAEALPVVTEIAKVLGIVEEQPEELNDEYFLVYEFDDGSEYPVNNKVGLGEAVRLAKEGFISNDFKKITIKGVKESYELTPDTINTVDKLLEGLAANAFNTEVFDKAMKENEENRARDEKLNIPTDIDKPKKVGKLDQKGSKEMGGELNTYSKDGKIVKEELTKEEENNTYTQYEVFDGLGNTLATLNIKRSPKEVIEYAKGLRDVWYISKITYDEEDEIIDEEIIWEDKPLEESKSNIIEEVYENLKSYSKGFDSRTLEGRFQTKWDENAKKLGKIENDSYHNEIKELKSIAGSEVDRLEKVSKERQQEYEINLDTLFSSKKQDVEKRVQLEGKLLAVQHIRLSIKDAKRDNNKLKLESVLNEQFEPFFFDGDDGDYFRDIAEDLLEEMKNPDAHYLVNKLGEYETLREFVDNEFSSRVLDGFGSPKEMDELYKYFKQEAPNLVKLGIKLWGEEVNESTLEEQFSKEEIDSIQSEIEEVLKQKALKTLGIYEVQKIGDKYYQKIYGKGGQPTLLLVDKQWYDHIKQLGSEDKESKPDENSGITVKENKMIKIQEELEDDDRAQALANYLEVDVDTLTDSGRNTYETEDGEEYLVLTEEEAYDAAKEDIENLFDDLGLESFAPNFQEWIKYNALNEEYFEDLLNDYIGNMDEESLRDEAEMLEIIDKDWEGDPYDLEEDIIEAIGDPVEYYLGIYGDGSELSAFLKDNPNSIDLDVVAEEAIAWDGVAHFIARYDGDEIELENDYFAYRTN